MRDYGRIYARYWTSADIQPLADQPKLLGAYLLSCAHGTIAGVFHLPDGYVADDLRWGIETLSNGFDVLTEIGFVKRCPTTKWVWVCKHLEWNVPEGPNQWKAVRKMAARVPSAVSWRTLFERSINPSEGVPKAIQNPAETPSNAGTGAGTGSEGRTVSVAGTGDTRASPASPPSSAQPPEGSSSRERFSKNNSHPKSPPRQRRNDSFERINADVLRLITDVGFEVNDPKRIAQVLHLSEAQAKTSIAQLRDRQLLPAESAAADPRARARLAGAP
jgi:hypothetical protein